MENKIELNLYKNIDKSKEALRKFQKAKHEKFIALIK